MSAGATEASKYCVSFDFQNNVLVLTDVNTDFANYLEVRLELFCSILKLKVTPLMKYVLRVPLWKTRRHFVDVV